MCTASRRLVSTSNVVHAASKTATELSFRTGGGIKRQVERAASARKQRKFRHSLISIAISVQNRIASICLPRPEPGNAYWYMEGGGCAALAVAEVAAPKPAVPLAVSEVAAPAAGAVLAVFVLAVLAVGVSRR